MLLDNAAAYLVSVMQQQLILCVVTAFLSTATELPVPA
jgi:hypothetical protein